MKDRSKFVSSLIVSLLAGFVYYQFSDAPVFQSFKAMLSDDLKNESIRSSQSFSAIISKDDVIPKHKSEKFYIQKKKIKPIEIDLADNSANEIIREFVSDQASISKKAAADINGYIAAMFNTVNVRGKDREEIEKLLLHPVPPPENVIEHLNKNRSREYTSLIDIPDNVIENNIREFRVQNECEDNSGYSYNYNYDYNYDYNYNYSYNYNYDSKNCNDQTTKKAVVKNKKDKRKNKNKNCETLNLNIEVKIPEVIVNMKMKKMTIQVPDAKNNLTEIVIEVPDPQIEIK